MDKHVDEISRRRWIGRGLAYAALGGTLGACGGGGGGDGSGGDDGPVVPPAQPQLPPIVADTLPRLRGTSVLPDTDWAVATSSRWTHIEEQPSAGANAVRLFLQPFSFADGASLLPGQSLAQAIAESMKQWGAMVDWCLSRKVYVILAINLEISYPAYGVWPSDGRSLWKDASAQDEFVAAWTALATQYAGRAGIVFDLLNEPHGITDDEIAGNHALPKSVWNALHQRTLNAVRAIDPARWLIVEPVWGDAANFADLSTNGDAKTIYSFHYYGPHYFTHQGVSGWPAAGTVHYPGVTQDASWQTPATWDKTRIAAEMKPAEDFGRAHGVRVMLGEFGSSRGAPAAERAAWTADVLAVADAAGHDLVYFQYDGWGVATDFTQGWAFENSPVEPLLQAQFARNKVS